MLNKERVRRLRKAAKLIAKAKPENFRMDFWALSDTTKVGCGTVACALGTCALNPEFNKLGLQLEDPSLEYIDNRLKFAFSVVFHDEYYERYLHFEAAEKFFNITEREATTLFSLDSYDTTRGKAARDTAVSRITKLADYYEEFGK